MSPLPSFPSPILIFFTDQQYVRNRKRKLFLRFANSQGADPQNPLFWYSLDPKKLRRFKVGFLFSLSLWFKGKERMKEKTAQETKRAIKLAFPVKLNSAVYY